ncbi:serine protease [Candidatus Kaiserbacteria bacterium]|nr:serine protease [Candidatus Kaiserbacteria bacterium]
MKMQRLMPYMGIVVGVYLFILTAVSINDLSVPQSTQTLTASSTLSVVPSYTVSPIILPNIGQVATSTQEVLPPPKKVVPSTKKTLPAQTPVITAPVSIPVVVQALSPVFDGAALDVSATTLRAALVNIICYAPFGGKLHSISGSGVFIDSKGIILTNAHIAQYFLLTDQDVACTIRTGSPATEKYKASLIHIPIAWLQTNSTVLTTPAPSGTGEHDFALLAVSKGTDRNALPEAFPSIEFATSPPGAQTPVVIASYGAQFLESSQLQSSLFPTIVFGSVRDVFTFAKTTIDVLALGGSAAAQEGSSGGGVANSPGELVGLITTSTITGETAKRSLNAITASYIRAEYASETGSALDLLLDQTTAISISNFAKKIPELAAIITPQLR